MSQDYHRLDIWQRAMGYVTRIYEFSGQLPQDERYNLTAQLRRAATSVPLNIAEGAGCSTNAEFARFLSYAYRSLKEVVTCLELCQRLYPALPSQPISTLIEEGNQLSRMTHGLVTRLGTQHSEVSTHSWSLARAGNSPLTTHHSQLKTPDSQLRPLALYGTLVIRTVSS